MRGIDFYDTKMGRRYYEHTLPALVDALERCATVLEAMEARWNKNDASSAPQSTKDSSSSEEQTPGSPESGTGST